MGVYSLTHEFQKHQKTVKLEDKTIAVDGNSFTYWLWNRDSHILGYYDSLLNIMNNFIEKLNIYNVKLIFVFDGVSSHHKNVTLKKRQQKKKEQYQQLISWANDGKFKPSIIGLSPLYMSNLINILRKNNIQIYGAKGEADNTIPFLDNINGILSNDSDYILFKKGEIPLYLLNTLNTNNFDIDVINCTDILKYYNVSYRDFVLACFYCGTDKIKLNKKFNNIEESVQYILKSKKNKRQFAKKKLIQLCNRNQSIKETIDCYDGKNAELNFLNSKNLWCKCLGNFRLSKPLMYKQQFNDITGDLINASRYIGRLSITTEDMERNRSIYIKIMNVIHEVLNEVTIESINSKSIVEILKKLFINENFSEEELIQLSDHTQNNETDIMFPINIDKFEKAIKYQYGILSLIEFFELYFKQELNLNYNDLFNEKKLWKYLRD